MMRLDTIIRKIEEAYDDHERVTSWKRETKRGSAEWKRLRSRQWAIRRKINGYIDRLDGRTHELTDTQCDFLMAQFERDRYKR